MDKMIQGEPQDSPAELPKINEADLLAKVNELQDQIALISNNKERILEESKGYKSKYQDLRGKIESKEKEDLESKEKWKELLEREREEKVELKANMNKFKRNSIEKHLRFEVAKLATDANPEYMEDIVNNLSLTPDLINEETGEVSGISQMLDGVRKSKPLFFTNNVPGMNQTVPQYVEQKGETKEELLARDPGSALNGVIAALLK